MRSDFLRAGLIAAALAASPGVALAQVNTPPPTGAGATGAPLAAPGPAPVHENGGGGGLWGLVGLIGLAGLGGSRWYGRRRVPPAGTGSTVPPPGTPMGGNRL